MMDFALMIRLYGLGDFKKGRLSGWSGLNFVRLLRAKRFPPAGCGKKSESLKETLSIAEMKRGSGSYART